MVSSNKKRDLTQVAICLVVILLINYVSGAFFTRFDFTKEKRYTLSTISKNIMDSLPKVVKVTVYLQSGDLPSGFKRLQSATRDMLTDMQAYSSRKLQFEFIDLLAGMNAEQQQQAIHDLRVKGIEPTNLSVKNDNGLTQKIIFPSAIVSADDKQIPVQLLQTRNGISYDDQLNNSIQNLEYDFASAIKKAVADGKPEIGFTEGHHELTDLQLNDALRSLADGFTVGRVNLKTISFASLLKIKLLVIPKPDKAFTEDEKYKIDQYLMRGGKILWCIDQVSAELDSLRHHEGSQLAFNKTLNLDDQLFRYGIRINYDMVLDMNCAQIPVNTGSIAGQGQMQLVPWLFYPIFVPTSKHPLVKNLDGIRSEFASTLDTLAFKGAKKTVLLSSSPFNKKLTSPHVVSLQMIEEVPKPQDFQSPPKPVAVLLEGTFISNFRFRPVPDSIHEQIPQLQQSKPTKMIVISDGDIFKNQIASDGLPFQLGFDRYTQQSYGNKNLLLNIVDYMTDESGLIELRTKEIQLRLLDKPRVRGEKLKWQLINNILPIALVLIFAIFQHYNRKRKYAH
ncbi:gliding-associated putative ABC transporter substrate-binding component GldG [Mucilaginibacter gracilis]|uniref:Gliding-associated putative ABC transporter substrate-binding component GldG n=1 Tax=Mucilaginibacter gracilis TaxID=423350 RepID=A0A495J8F7_9SPHI|nr:gliding motility-associated ABC transporter substrate-binding protein GldG [Mucilaginibacter gracilis]RKR85265.1 gliding-associated putative ABC transporter substrate-binding component GldG [Mucilaginibacter gracilis]